MSSQDLTLAELLSLAIPLGILAFGAIARFVLYLLVSTKAGKWFNKAVKNLHDENHKRAEKEAVEIEKAQIEAQVYYSQFDSQQLLTVVVSQLQKMSESLERTRIEQEAQHNATAARAEFSNLRMVWQWLRHCGNRKIKLDSGTRKKFMSKGPSVANPPPRSSSSTTEPDDSSSSAPTSESPFYSGNVGGSTGPHADPQITVIIPPPPTAQVTAQLERLSVLVDRGFLTQEEFDILKAQLMNS